MPLPKSFPYRLECCAIGRLLNGARESELMLAGRRQASFFCELKLVHSSPGGVMINYFPYGVYDRLVICLLEQEYASNKEASKAAGYKHLA